MYILCDLKGQCLNHDHVVYEYIGVECSKLRQPMRAIFALSRTQLLLLVVTRSRDLSRECNVTKPKTPARSNFPLSNLKIPGPFNSAHRAIQEGCAPKILKKRAHPIELKHQFWNNMLKGMFVFELTCTCCFSTYF